MFLFKLLFCEERNATELDGIFDGFTDDNSDVVGVELTLSACTFPQ